MKNRNYFSLIFGTFVVLFSFNIAHGQLCDEAGNAKALNTQTQWVLDSKEARNKNWVTAFKPILMEMQRVFPQPPKGLFLRNSYSSLIDLAASPNEIHRYQGYFAIRHLICFRSGGMNKFVPFDDPESFVYFNINRLDRFLSEDFPNLRTGDLRIVENPNGIKSLYDFNENGEQTFIGWYFSENKGLPFRRLSKAELAQKFWEYRVTELDHQIISLEKPSTNVEKEIADTNANPYLTEANKQKIIEGLRQSEAARTKADVEKNKTIETLKAQRENIIRRTEAMQKAPDAKSDARVTLLTNNINDLEAPVGKGKYVFVENKDFFNQKLPKWQPQFILVRHHRYDKYPGQADFNNKFENEFDFNAVRQLVGMQPMAKAATITGMGGTVGSEPGKKSENSNTESANGVMFAEDFANATLEQKPPNWTVSNDTAIVKNIDDADGKWLALKKSGLFYPDFSLLLLPNKFTLEFDVRWNKKISYNSPNFLFHIGEARYDNTVKRYDKEQVNPAMPMNRIEIWLDPHWNYTGRYGLTRYDNRGGYLKDISDKTSAFYKEANLVRVKIVRDGARIRVYLNDKATLEDPKIALDENIRWNFFGFGLWGGDNAEKLDEFYVSNIRLTKQQ
jgi:hypothetical protein